MGGRGWKDGSRGGRLGSQGECLSARSGPSLVDHPPPSPRHCVVAVASLSCLTQEGTPSTLHLAPAHSPRIEEHL